MRTADGLALLREIARKYGPVRIAYDGADARPWGARLVGSLCHEYGPTLEEAVAALYDQLERLGKQA